jgi:hypothetical protein
MVYIRVALSDPDIGGKSQSHRVDLTISDDQTIIAVYNGLCGSIFFDLLNSNSRGLDFVVFSGKNNVTLELEDVKIHNCGVQKWNEVCDEFHALGLVSFTIFARPRIAIELNRELQVRPLHGMFLPRSQQIESLHASEIKERGELLPHKRSVWETLNGVGKFTLQPYVLTQWDAVIELFFRLKNIKYTEVTINNGNHPIY